MNKTKLFRSALLGALVLSAAASAFAGFDVSIRIGRPAPIVVTAPPPALRHERMGHRPSERYVWVPGHYVWERHRWQWVHGIWIIPPHERVVWVDGTWDQSGRTWIEGHWEETPEMIVEMAPPPPPHEVVIVRPSPSHVWIAGYWRWHDGRHVWVNGRWEAPPRGFREWIAPRWDHRGHGYVFVDGRWH